MAGKYNDLETHGQPDGITAGVVAEHITGNQPGTGDYDVVLAAIQLQTGADRVEESKPSNPLCSPRYAVWAPSRT